jgi:hypothetical protein
VLKVVERVALVKSSDASDIVYKLLHDDVAQNDRFGVSMVSSNRGVKVGQMDDFAHLMTV